MSCSVESEPDKFMLPKQRDMRYHWVVVRLDEDRPGRDARDRPAGLADGRTEEGRPRVLRGAIVVGPATLRDVGTLNEFFEDERRRESPEKRFGSRWRSVDDEGAVYSIFWLAATGELCALEAPATDVKVGGGLSNIFTSPLLWANTQPPADASLFVSVLGMVIEDESELDDAYLAGWERTSEGEPDRAVEPGSGARARYPTQGTRSSRSNRQSLHLMKCPGGNSNSCSSCSVNPSFLQIAFDARFSIEG